MTKSFAFALGVVWILVTVCIGLWMGAAVVSSHLKDCERLGHFRYGDRVIECRVLP